MDIRETESTSIGDLIKQTHRSAALRTRKSLPYREGRRGGLIGRSRSQPKIKVSSQRRYKREGVFHPIQHDPTVMSISVNELLNGCNRILLVPDGAIGSPLHRHCTKRSRRAASLLRPQEIELVKKRATEAKAYIKDYE